MIRTRAIIKGLSYDDLVKQGVIPDILPLIGQSQTVIATKRYPPFVYAAKDFAFFGMLMDYIIRAGLRLHLTQKIELGTDPVADIIPILSDDQMVNIMGHLNNYQTSNNINDIARSALVLVSTLYGKTIYSQEEIQRYIPSIVNILKEIIEK
jgi:hypothetical protein